MGQISSRGLKGERVKKHLDSVISKPTNREACNYLARATNGIWDAYSKTRAGRTHLGNLADALDVLVGEEFAAESVTACWLRSLKDMLLDAGKDARQPTPITIRSFLLTAYDLGFHPCCALFDWMERNAEAMREVTRNFVGRAVYGAITTDGTPSFELLSQHILPHGKGGTRVTPLTFDTDSTFVRQLILRTMREANEGRGARQKLSRLRGVSEFTTSMGFTPTSLQQFTVETFSRQFDYFDSGEDPQEERNLNLRILTYIYAMVMSLLPNDQEQFTIRTGLTRSIITRCDFLSKWRDGYQLVVHNPSDPAPENPRWFLLPNDDEVTKASISPSAKTVDLSYPDENLQRLLVSWVWSECDSATYIRVEQKWTKALLAVLEKDGGLYRATGDGVSGWLGSLKAELNSPGVSQNKKYGISLLDYGKRLGLILVDPTADLLLNLGGHNHKERVKDIQPANLNDAKILATELERRATESLVNELVYRAFVAISLTQLRISSVLDLRIGDFAEDNVGGIHSVVVSTKPDGHGRREIQLPGRVYRLLTGIVKLTDGIRCEAPPDLADHLFIYKSESTWGVRKMENADFFYKVKTACRDLGIDGISSLSMRKRYHTEVVVRGVAQNESRLALKALTGHSSLSVTEKHYVREDVRSRLEATYGIEIGVPKMRGDVIGDDELTLASEENPESDVVEHGAGYCRNETCNVAGTVSCLMCEGFVTTPRCIPEMEEALENIQRRLRESADNLHEREHLLSVKRLYLGYLAVMYSKNGDDDERSPERGTTDEPKQS